jgi:hypothetical protein
VGYVRAALKSPKMRAEAAATLREAPIFLHQERRPKVRLSDVGSCRLELWAKMHDACELKDDPIDSILTRMDQGTLYGAWVGALIAAAAKHDGWSAALEQIVDFENCPGHLDVLLRTETTRHVVELKSHNDDGAVKDPWATKRANVLQLIAYGAATGSPTGTVLYIGPNAPKGRRLQQFHFDIAPFVGIARDEYARLKAAEADAPPVADPQERWQCATCRYTTCPKNKNKAATSLEALLA